jgi:tetratricopeptide (TPR) repeat protein/predicted Ser/Thr protein kinase
MRAGASPAAREILQTIGKYQVEKVLGRGGMGTVYRALDPVLHRTVALKTMIPGLADDPELKARFQREAQAAGGLRHHNIVTVYDLGEDRGQPYIAMELVEGADLEKIIQARDPMSIESKIDVIRQVCEGLGYAHRNGIVHRDVKPANIRVTPEGEVKIMDFGIAHLQSSTLTRSGLVLGTIHYMAPEQVEGGKVDHRADVFSVGAIAYELLSFRRPFDADILTGVMLRIMREAPDMTALPRSEYSPGLEAVVARALAKPLAERYQTLEEMRDDLERLVRGTAARLLASARSSPAAAAATSPRIPPAEVEADVAQRTAAIAEARAAGQLQKALTLCRRLVEAHPDDARARRLCTEVEVTIGAKEVEQLAGMSLAYAADGDLDLAVKIADRVGRMAPESARYRELVAYLDEEASRRATAALVATAQEHIVLGNLDEARAAAAEALAAHPDHALAREIRDRADAVIQRRDRALSPPSAPPPAPPRPGPTVPDGAPTEADTARARDRARRAEAASLTTAALDHFLHNDHGRARAVVEKALTLDPGNRRAQELLDVLGALG